DHIGKSFTRGTTETEVLTDIRLDIEKGEYVSIIGHSGCGKSTLLNIVAGLLPVSTGGVILEGREVNDPGPDRAVVFQNHSLLPWLTVYGNVAIAVDKVFGASKSKAERHDWVMHNLELVQMAQARDKRPHEVSGGMKQRVGIARSLAVEPDVWFLDEPFSALDPLIRKQMQDEFLRIQAKLRKSIVFITHDFQEALRIADRMAIMRDGAIVQIGRPIDLILNPADDYIREFTQDVPWERILRASDIMEPPAGCVEGLRRVAADTLVESLLPDLGSFAAGVVVEGPDGAVLGVATARGLAASLALGCVTADPAGRASGG
ncbi:MAG: ABC transporter ATP-binding protein, partial [Verrucomicrobiaceae bacterium]